ncbi:hypothetical protein T08_10167 [Trichinella sp. T8]|nr:hypothetical protein T08_10167 [Trichinella sp. T8]
MQSVIDGISITYASAEVGCARAPFGLVEGTGVPRDENAGHPVNGGRDDVTLAMSHVAGQGPLHELLSQASGVRPKDSLSTPVEEGPLRESLRGGRSTEHPQRNPRAQNGTTMATLRSLRLQYPSPGAAHFAKVGRPLRKRRLRRVDVSLGADSDSEQPVASRRVQAFIIPRICEKEIDLSYKSHEASVPEMKRQQGMFSSLMLKCGSCPHSGKRFLKLIISTKNQESAANSFNLSINSASKRTSKSAMSTAP